MEIEQGEEYLTVDIAGMKVNLYPNKEKSKNTDPDYKGTVRVALWRNTKKQPIQQQSWAQGYKPVGGR